MKIGVHDDHEWSDSCAVAYVHVLMRRNRGAAANRDVVSNRKERTRSCDQVGDHGSRRQVKPISDAQLPSMGIDRRFAS